MRASGEHARLKFQNEQRKLTSVRTEECGRTAAGPEFVIEMREENSKLAEQQDRSLDVLVCYCFAIRCRDKVMPKKCDETEVSGVVRSLMEKFVKIGAERRETGNYHPASQNECDDRTQPPTRGATQQGESGSRRVHASGAKTCFILRHSAAQRRHAVAAPWHSARSNRALSCADISQTSAQKALARPTFSESACNSEATSAQASVQSVQSLIQRTSCLKSALLRPASAHLLHSALHSLSKRM